MKFDIVRPDQEGEGPSDPAVEDLIPPSQLRLRQASDHMRLRARTDLTRARSALDRMLHTVEAARAKAETGSGPDAPDAPDLFRPSAFRAPAPETSREQRQEDSP